MAFLSANLRLKKYIYQENLNLGSWPSVFPHIPTTNTTITIITTITIVTTITSTTITTN